MSLTGQRGTEASCLWLSVTAQGSVPSLKGSGPPPAGGGRSGPSAPSERPAGEDQGRAVLGRVPLGVGGLHSPSAGAGGRPPRPSLLQTSAGQEDPLIRNTGASCPGLQPPAMRDCATEFFVLYNIK